MSIVEREQNQRVIRVVPHDPDWRNQFGLEAAKLRDVFGKLLEDIHHIGSTAVPGLSAKPVIDIMIEVSSLEKVDEHNIAMEALGYEARGEYGIPNRRFFQKGGNQPSHNVHVFPARHRETIRHLRFRNYMRAHPLEVADYALLKGRLAKEFPHDIDGYCDGKDAYIKDMDRRAKAWAESMLDTDPDSIQVKA